MGRIARKTRDDGAEQLMTLDAIEALLGGGCTRQPSDRAWVRTAPGVLEAMTRGNGCAFATLRCERQAGGMRIVGGQDVLLVARKIRAGAMVRGDLAWGTLMGQRLVFRVTTQPAATREAGRSETSRRRLGRSALTLATS